MSAFHGIVCDYSGCTERHGSDTAKSMRLVRADAADDGWKITGVFDVCPLHADCASVVRRAEL